MNIKMNFLISNKKLSNKILLFLIFFIAIVLRLYKLGEYPIHLTNDEAAIGYNAYSILKTARDEHGEFLPIIFKSFGDWKPGLYIYATVPSVWLFGINEFATRLPSAIAGIISVYLVYLLCKKLFTSKIAFFASFSLAINPWHIHFSRGAWEANLALTLLLAGIWFFYQTVKEKKYFFLIISSSFFALTLWAYQSAKLASLLPLVVLVFIYRGYLLKIPKKYLFAAVTVGLLISTPIVLSVFNGKAGRIEVMSIFSYERPKEYIQETILNQENITQDSLLFKLFHSEALNFARGILGRYLNYFSGRFLFFEGDWSSLRHSSANVGYLLFAEIPVLILGLFQLFKKRKNKEAAFFLFWLFLAPIPAAITRDSVHGVRALNLIIPLVVVLGFGLSFLIKYFKLIFIFIVFPVYLYSMLIYINSYYVQNLFVNAKNYFYGYREVVKELDAIGKNKAIVFDQSFDQPYIFFLFYQRIEPSIYQEQVDFSEVISGDVGFVNKLNNILFRPITWENDKELKNTLIVGKAVKFPLDEVENIEVYNLKKIKYPNGDDDFYIVERK